jgi:hypothetical protein
LCEKFKGPENFSNKELNDYRHKKLVNKSTNEISAKLRCRQCSGAQVQELQCEGHCGNWLPLSEFSKSSRTNGTYVNISTQLWHSITNHAQWCKRCTNWKEGQEPGIVTAPAPNAEVVPDKDGTYNGNGSLSEPEDDASDDDWDVAVSHFETSDISMDIKTDSRQTNAATSPAAREGSFMDVPRIQVPYSDMVPSSAIASLSIAAAQSASGGASNMTQNINDEVKTQSSASNPYENSKSDATVTQSGWNAVDARRRAPVGPPIAFNAWSPNGEQQLRYR